MKKRKFEELEGQHFNYLWFVTHNNVLKTKTLKTKWLSTLKDAGWTEDEYNKEFDKRYPPRLTS
jgi:hypothetical protein